MSELEGIVYSRDREMVGFITDPAKVEIDPAWAGRSISTFTVPADHDYADAFQEPGARITWTFRGADVFSGWIHSNDSEFVTPGADVTYTCIGDDAVLDDVRAFVAPQRPLAASSLTDLAQATRVAPAGTAGTVTGQGGHFLWPAGTADSVEGAVRELLRANLVERLGLPYVLADDLGRGGRPLLPEVRFLSLREAIAPLLVQAPNLGLRIRQAAYSNTITIDFVVAERWDQVITDDSGILTGGSGGTTGPEATRTIAGGPGDLAARVFQATTEGTNRTPTEQQWGRVIETFRDATGLQLTWPDSIPDDEQVPKYAHIRLPDQAAALRTYLNTEATKDVDAGRPAAALGIELTEGETFAFGGVDGLQLGTVLPLVIRGVGYTERVTSARIRFTPGDGLTATPLLGTRSGDPDQDLMDAVVAVHRALQRRSTQI